MNKNLEKIKQTGEKYGLFLTNDKLKKFELFVEYLTAYNSHTNLVSSNDISLIYDKHIIDSLAFGKYLANAQDYKIIDIGSGGGFPVLPMAIVLDKCEITAVDSTKKKTDFIKQCAEFIGLKNLTVLNVRAEQLAHSPDFRENYDIATARAVGNLSQISELCLPFLIKDGLFIAYKSAKVQEEIAQAKLALEILGGNVAEIFEYELTLQENFQRNLVAIKKVKYTPEAYPRSFSLMKNRPL